jgi:hypothetical protein
MGRRAAGMPDLRPVRGRKRGTLTNKTRYNVYIAVAVPEGQEFLMSAPSDPGLSRREEMSISGAVMSEAPWKAAAVTGGVVAAADLGLHVIGGGLGMGAVSGSLSAGAAVFVVVAAAGALWRAKSTGPARWARSNPWQFAVLPAVAAAAIALVLTVVTGGGMIHGIFSALWHGGAVYGLTGAVGALTKSRKQSY